MGKVYVLQIINVFQKVKYQTDLAYMYYLINMFNYQFGDSLGNKYSI